MTSAQAVTVLRRLRKLAAAPADGASDAQLLARFADQHDQTAFAGLVERHGPMVLGVCRGVLHNWHDAEDAFQATFLVLVRKAATIRKGESVAGWLYGVAYHAAVRAQADAARRRAREKRAAEMPSADPLLDMTLRDVRQVLHEELHKLPEKYRAPLVLCYLEGQSQEEAAKQLGWSKGTTRGRLDRGREALRKRLARRGLALSAVLGAAALGAASPVSAALVESVVGAALPSAGGAAVVSAKASALAEGVMHAMFAGKVKTATAVLLAAVVITAGAGQLLHNAHAAHAPESSAAAPPAREKAKAKEAAKEEKPDATFAGRVLGPDGKPVAGAKLFVLYYTPRVLPIPQRGTSEKDGSFRFTVAKKEFDRSSTSRPWDQAIVVAIADGYGLGVPDLEPGKRPVPTALTLRLAKDDVPITGRVLDLQGKPVAGATISVHSLHWPTRSNDLTAWLAQLKKTKEGYPALRAHLMSLEGKWMGRDVGRIMPTAVTGPDGRFRLKGVGRERVVALRIQGPTIVSTELWAMTRPGDKIRTAMWRRGSNDLEMVFHGAAIEHLAAPCRPIVGVVRDKDSGKPVAGAVVQSYVFAGTNLAGQTRLRAVTDKEGRYRLLGMPKGMGNQVRIIPPEGQPYLMALVRVPDGPGIEPVTANVELRRGVWITGQVTDKATGKPVHSLVHYLMFPDNPNCNLAPFLAFEDNMQTRAEDGTFRFVAPPGHGAVTAYSWTPGYLPRVGADKIKGLDRLPFVQEFHAVAEVNPEKGAESVTCNLVLGPGRTLAGTVVGPDGKPLAGARVSGLREHGDWEYQPEEGAGFTVLALKPGESRLLQFLHAEKKLAGSLVVRGDEKGPVTVKLGPAAVLTGRFVTTDGKPLADVEVVPVLTDPRIRPKDDVTVGSFPRGVRTDRDGKFRIEGLAPGLKYRLALVKGMYYLRPEGELAKGVTVKAGETKDLGEVKIKLPDE